MALRGHGTQGIAVVEELQSDVSKSIVSLATHLTYVTSVAAHLGATLGPAVSPALQTFIGELLMAAERLSSAAR